MRKLNTIDNSAKGDAQETNWIKAYIVDVLPCLTALLYMLAVVYNIAFFSAFNIDITDFIYFGDILVSIIQPLLLLSLFLLLMVALIVYLIPSLVYRSPKKSEQKVYKKGRLHYMKLLVRFLHSSIFYKSFKLFTFSLLVIAPTYYFLFTKGYINNFEGRYSGFVPIFIPVFLTIVLFVSKVLFRSKLTIFQQFRNVTAADKILTFILYFVFAVAVVYESGYRDGKSILERDEVKFKLTLTDNSTYDNKGFTYIKHSDGRIFLYDKSKSSSLIVFEENVLSLDLYSKTIQKKSVINWMLDNFGNFKK